MERRKLFFALIAGLSIICANRASACTGITLKSKDNGIVTARTIEWGESAMETNLIREESAGKARQNAGKFQAVCQKIWKYRAYYVLMLPAVIYVAIFCYAPMYGLQIAFKDYRPVKKED